MFKESTGEPTKIDNPPPQERLEQTIREELRNWPEAADWLFAEYDRLASGAEQAAEEISRLYYDEIFFDKQIDKNQITEAILKRVGRLLVEAEEKLKDAPENDKPALIKELTEGLARRQIAQNRILADFKELAHKLNRQAKQVVADWQKADWQEFKNWERKSLKHEDLNEEEIEDLLADEGLVEVEEAETPEIIKRKKFDSSKVKETIEELESRYTKTLAETSSILKVKDFAKMWGVSETEAQELLEKKRQWEEEKYKPYVLKLKKLLELQAALEGKLEEIIYGKKPTETEQSLEQSLPLVILNKYQELVGLIKKNKKELAGLFKKNVSFKDEDLDEIAENILKKAKEYLANFIELAESGETIDEAEAMWKLDSYQADTILQFSARKRLVKEENIKPEDLKGVVFERLSATELVANKNFPVLDKLTESLLAKKVIFGSGLKGAIKELFVHLNTQEKRNMNYVYQMMEIYKANYEEESDKQPRLLNDFRLALEKGDTVVYLYHQGEQILAWVRYDKKGAGKKFVASFNTLPGLKGFDIGMPLFAASLEIEGAGGAEIEAEADPFKFVTPKYIENNGFVTKQAFMKNNYAYFKISRAEKNKNYLLRKLSEAEIIKLGLEPAEATGDNFVLKLKAGDQQIFTAAENYLNQGFILSRYIVKGGFAYLGFEKA